jgi:hypothetical protein
MASWTDKIPTFNPYVAQLPVDAMLKVGMIKQQKYEDGIQKIQTNIDNVAGLDIGRDVDKNYLQSKLNSLGNDLKWVAAGDFSNFQLVNSVNGMTNQIAKDEYVQAAVSSTSSDRNQMSLIEDARKKGTLTPHAEYNYQLQRNSYYGNNNLKQEDGAPIVFSGKYSPSWDIDKNMLEAIKAVGDSTWTADNVFKLDGNGNKMHNKDGSPMYSEFAIREKRAGRFNENITAAIDSVLSRPEAKKELAMQGVYNYRGYDNIDDFVSQYKAEKEKGIAIGESQKIDLMSKINIETNPILKKQYQQQLNKIESDVLELSTTEDTRIAEAEGYGNNLDNYKAALQTQRKRNDYMKMGVTETYSKEYIESIPYKVAQEKIKAERDWFMANDASRRGWTSLDLQQKRDKLSADKWEYVKTHPPGTPATPEVPLADPVEPGSLYGKVLQDATDAEVVMNNEKDNFVFKYIKALNFGNGKDLTDEQVRKSIFNYAKNDPTFVDRMYDKGKQDVINHPQNENFTDLVTALPKLNEAESNLIYNNNKLNDPDVVAAGGGVGVDFATIEKGLETHIIEYEDTNSGVLGFGRSTIKRTVTASDIVNAAIIQEYSNQRSKLSDVERSILKNAKSKIESKFNMSSDSFISKLSPSVLEGGPGGSIATSQTPEARTMRDFNKARSLIQTEKFGNALMAKEKVLQEKSKGNLPLKYTIYPKDAKGTQITSVDNRVDAVLSTFKEGDINVAEFANLKKNNAGYTTFIKVDRDNNNKISLALYNGTSLVKDMEITKPQMDYIKGVVTVLPAKVSRIQQQIDWSQQKGTTNSAGVDPQSPTAYKTAWFKPEYFFSKFNRSDVLGADVKKNEMGQPNVYFYIKNQTGNVKGIPYKFERGDVYPHAFESVDAAENWVKNIVTRSGDIDNIINNSKPTK